MGTVERSPSRTFLVAAAVIGISVANEGRVDDDGVRQGGDSFNHGVTIESPLEVICGSWFCDDNIQVF